MAMAEKRIVLIDGFSLLFRAFYATRYLTTTDGRPTNALYGFLQMLFTTVEKVNPQAIVVALDAPGKTFRHAEYVDYKGTRKETQDELKVQLAAAKELIEALGIPAIEATGFEADDIIGTLSKLAEGNGYDTSIVTGDLDALQLVDAHVSVITPRQGMAETVTYTPSEVIERFGVGPELVPDYKAIKGDTSDNIPGVAGIGDKGAAILLQEFGTIEMLLDRLQEVPAKYLAKIEPQIEQMKMSKWLATIVRDVPLEYDFAPFILTQSEFDQAQAFLEGYEFKSLTRRFAKVFAPYLDQNGGEGEGLVTRATVEIEPIAFELIKVDSPEELGTKIGNQPYAIILSPPAAQGLFDVTEAPAYLAVGPQVWETSGEIAKEFFYKTVDQAIIHDAKPHYRKKGSGMPTAPPLHDTLLSGFVLQSGRSQYGLADLIQGYLDVQPPSSHAEAAAALYALRPALEERLEKEGETKVFREIEMPLIPVLAKMEATGICADRKGLREFSQVLQAEIEKTQTLIFEKAGREFLIGSPKQLGQVLFDELKLPGAVKTKTGYATGVEVLGELAGEHPIAAEVLSWRELSKLKSTYADSLERLIQEDGRIHTTYNQTGAATGRLSSIDPNLQNIPIRTDLGRPIRQAFHAGEGYQLLSIDYSQIELRVLAHMCEEPALVRAFQEGEDVHSVTAASVFNLGSEPPSKEQRRVAKMLNYAVLYGVSEFGLSQQLGASFSVAEARELIRQYNERFPSVHGFTQSIIQEARSKGFTTTLMGRRRFFPEIHASRMNDRKAAERQAMNAPIQGTAADMLKMAMIDVSKIIAGSPIRMLLTVHDELVFEVPTGEPEPEMARIAEAMESALPLKVPVTVDAKLGPNWNEMKANELNR